MPLLPIPWFPNRAIAGYEMLEQEVSVAAEKLQYATIIGPQGKKVLSGGWEQDGDWLVLDSYPINDSRGSGWGFTVKNISKLDPAPDTIRLYALFASG